MPLQYNTLFFSEKEKPLTKTWVQVILNSTSLESWEGEVYNSVQ